MVVPVIDFSKLNGDERAQTMAQIHGGCQDWGFFQFVNHGITEELLERVKKVNSKRYKMESEEGFKRSKPVQMLNQLMENKSGEKLDGVDWEDVFLLTDDNDWPSKVPGFKETMAEYRAELKKLAEIMMEIMDENLGLPLGYIKKAFNNGGSEEAAEANDTAFFGTKISHYPPCPEPELVTGLRAHTDAGGVILLFQDDQVGGLQMLKGQEWIDVQPIPNAIVINIGDQIEVLSNGRYKSAWHRVLVGQNGNGRSIASFYNPAFKATIAPAPQLVKEAIKKGEKEGNTKGDNDIVYPKFLFGDYTSVYAEQKFQPKEPRFQAVKAM